MSAIITNNFIPYYRLGIGYPCNKDIPILARPPKDSDRPNFFTALPKYANGQFATIIVVGVPK
ncbi:MAG: hypothetical protein IPG99_15100 [Ignavibacteria bacterium]|nr:hypothetical protein [Ignavibacteria bacterium]